MKQKLQEMIEDGRKISNLLEIIKNTHPYQRSEQQKRLYELSKEYFIKYKESFNVTKYQRKYGKTIKD